jgi:hypothetical protein
MDSVIHHVWIGERLSLLEQLTLKLYQKQGFTPNLWAYDRIENVPDGVVIRDAEEILPRRTVFAFEPKYVSENFGTGSYSLWSDRFQLSVLQKFGGWYSQLDVACIKWPEDTEYYFSSDHFASEQGFDPSVMKVPQHAEFIPGCIKELEERVNQRTAGFGWCFSMEIMSRHIKNHGLWRFASSNVEQNGCLNYMTGTAVPSENTEFIHWWNALWSKELKNTPQPGSFYHKLLMEVGLI